MPQKSRSLTSAKNPAVQRFRDAAAGRAEGLMLAEGVRLVWDAVRAGVEVVEVAVSPKPGDIDLRDALAERAGSFLDVSDALLQRLSALDTPQGVAAVLRRPSYDDGELGFCWFATSSTTAPPVSNLFCPFFLGVNARRAWLLCSALSFCLHV